MLADLPALFILVGLVAYAVLAGADFGAGAWALLTPADTKGRVLRDHARHQTGPVWEANHVWLIFILVICWTAYPTAFGSIASTLAVPLFLAAIGIVLRGTAYVLRGAAEDQLQADRFDRLFGLSSVFTPFALGAAIGGIASGRVPVGNAAGDQFSSWLNSTSIVLGAMFVATSIYLAAVYLAADAQRLGEPELERAFRERALAAGLVAGGLAIAGLIVVHSDTPSLWDGLTGGGGIAALAVSGAAGVVTLALVWRSRFQPARFVAALAVAAIVAGWAVAQEPQLLPGLTVRQAAAPDSTLRALVIAVLGGSVILLPSLALLFRLYLKGGFDPAAASPERGGAVPAGAATPPRAWDVPLSLALFVAGTAFMVLGNTTSTRLLGLAGLTGFAMVLFRRVAVPSEDGPP
jgi:cytochrome d ubiquinol oxidase subunit II